MILLILIKSNKVRTRAVTRKWIHVGQHRFPLEFVSVTQVWGLVWKIIVHAFSPSLHVLCLREYGGHLSAIPNI